MITRSTPIVKTPRLLQVAGMFDLAVEEASTLSWSPTFSLPDEWNIGLIVGPSGSGKTTIARDLFGLTESFEWPKDKSIIDGFPIDMPIKEIALLLSSVGFSSPPSWLRPYHVLSNGEQFRVNMARAMAEPSELIVIDEFTSVVDRTVAQIGSAAIAKSIRRRKQKFIAVTCHYDIIDWLEPDWIYEPHIDSFNAARGSVRRPKIDLHIQRVDSSAWRIFKHHHYLDTKIHRSARCFCAFWQGEPVAFAAVLHFPHPSSAIIKRGHRTVCLPDYQGVGIGNALSNAVGSMVTGLGFRYQSQTSHPAVIAYRAKSPDWTMISKPNAMSKTMGTGNAKGLVGGRGIFATRFRATFEYVGKPMTRFVAQKIWG